MKKTTRKTLLNHLELFENIEESHTCYLGTEETTFYANGKEIARITYDDETGCSYFVDCSKN